MPLTTALQCPHCGHSAQTTKSISTGAAIRCPACVAVFRIGQDSGNRAMRVPSGGGLEKNRLAELLAEDTKPVSRRDDCVDIRVLNDHGDRLPPRAAGPVAAKEKIKLDHKPLVWHKSRTMFAGVLLAVAVLAGYGFFRWYTDTVVELDAAAATAGVKRTEKMKELAGGLGKPKPARKFMGPGSSAAASPFAPGSVPASPLQNTAAPAPASTRTTAPATQRIGDLVVGVAAAQLVKSQPTYDEILRLTLRVTNLSAKPVVYTGWAGPNLIVTLKDQNGNYYNRIASGTPAEQAIDPSRTITDTLEFEKPLAGGAILDLDLPTTGKAYEFRIPAAFIQRAQPTVAVATVAKKGGRGARPRRRPLIPRQTRSSLRRSRLLGALQWSGWKSAPLG